MNTTLNCRGKLITLERPIIMGIVNINDDSFYIGSRCTQADDVLSKVEEMLLAGATIIDIGAMSTRPGAKLISQEIELSRLLPAISAVLNHFPQAIISIDTMRSDVAAKCINIGAAMINDISAGNFDEDMMATVAKLNVPYVMMHMQGMPSNMQEKPEYSDVVLDVLGFFAKKIKLAEKAGIQDLIIDPGFGFGKTLDHNFTLLQQLDVFSMFDRPVLVGLSRKSMIYKHLGLNPEQALNGTSVLHTMALTKGAKILRVHDVKEAMECVSLLEKLK